MQGPISIDEFSGNGAYLAIANCIPVYTGYR